jgi:hypothetical protein
MIFEANGSYKPPHKEIKESHRLLLTKGSYPYREQLDVLKKQSRVNRIAGLVEILGDHHRDTLAHTFEDTLLALTFAQGICDKSWSTLGHNQSGSRDAYLSKIIEVFEGSLIHDIGKTGVDQRLLNTDDKSALSAEERHRIRLHGTLGGAILHELGLDDLKYFSYEHSLGSGKSGTWKREELNSRHELTEIIALADLIGGLLDPRRPYHNPVTREYLLWLVETKGRQGVYSKKLIRSFRKKVADKDMYPPFHKEDYENNELFMKLIHIYGIIDIFEKTILEDQLTRNNSSTRIEKS